MRKKIEIKSINQWQTDTGCNVTFGLELNGHARELTYKIHGEGITSLAERCDCVVTSLLLYAVRNDMDICSEIPISEKLYYNFVKHVIPQMLLVSRNKKAEVNLIMPTANEEPAGSWRGTGLSMGIDSFATLHEYLEDSILPEYKLTHLVHLKTGAHYGSDRRAAYSRELEDKIFTEENNRVKAYCREYGFKLVTIESNLFEITSSEFEMNFVNTHTMRNLGAVMLLSGYFDKYYYASGANLDTFDFNIYDAMAYYEKWLIPYLDGGSIKFYSANGSMTRMEKTKYIADFPDTYNYLHVCCYGNENCGSCNKCVRTLVQMDLLGVVDKYENVFDLEAYRKNKKKYMNKIAALHKRDFGYGEIYEYMKEHGIKTPGFFARNIAKLKLCWGMFSRFGVKPLIRRIKN